MSGLQFDFNSGLREVLDKKVKSYQYFDNVESFVNVSGVVLTFPFP